MKRTSIAAVLFRIFAAVPHLRFCGLLLLTTCTTLPASAQDSPGPGLAEFVGKNLQRLDEAAAAEFRDRFEKMTGDKLPPHGDLNSTQPRWLKPFVTENTQWAMVATYPGYDIPDVSNARIDLFDKHWKRISTEIFPTGYRLSLTRVEIDDDNPLKRPILVARLIPSRDLALEDPKSRDAREKRLYIARAGERWVAIRFENVKQELIQVGHAGRVPLNGPVPPKPSKDEWMAQLKSESVVEQLAALAWLSARHLPSTDRRYENVFQESVENSRLFESVRDADETRTLLSSLVTSENSWVRDAASFARQKIDK